MGVTFTSHQFESTMNDKSERKCPDCDGSMVPISIIDRSRLNEIQSIDSLLSYTSAAAKPGWLGNLKAEGTVSAFACNQCGRILLYAKKA